MWWNMRCCAVVYRYGVWVFLFLTWNPGRWCSIVIVTCATHIASMLAGFWIECVERSKIIFHPQNRQILSIWCGVGAMTVSGKMEMLANIGITSGLFLGKKKHTQKPHILLLTGVSIWRCFDNRSNYGNPRRFCVHKCKQLIQSFLYVWSPSFWMPDKRYYRKQRPGERKIKKNECHFGLISLCCSCWFKQIE